MVSQKNVTVDDIEKVFKIQYNDSMKVWSHTSNKRWLPFEQVLLLFASQEQVAKPIKEFLTIALRNESNDPDKVIIKDKIFDQIVQFAHQNKDKT